MILFIVFFFLYLGRLILRPPEPFNMYLGRVISVLAILNIGFLIYKIFDFGLLKVARPASRESKTIIDSQLVPLVKRLAAIFIFCIVIILCMENMGVDVTSLLAGLSIGGIAVALAARETLSNVFGAITLVSNPPFHPGDTVEIGGEIGIIKEVGMMNTVIEKFDSTHEYVLQFGRYKGCN